MRNDIRMLGCRTAVAAEPKSSADVGAPFVGLQNSNFCTDSNRHSMPIKNARNPMKIKGRQLL
jgi:hypothetical protein